MGRRIRWMMEMVGGWAGVKDVPGVKYDLVAFATLLFFKLKVVHGPTTLVLGQIGDKVVVIRRRRSFLHDDLLLVIADSEGDVLVLLAEFQLLEHVQAFRVYANAGRLGKVSCSICWRQVQACDRTISVLC